MQRSRIGKEQQGIGRIEEETESGTWKKDCNEADSGKERGVEASRSQRITAKGVGEKRALESKAYRVAQSTRRPPYRWRAS
jgi:hypothetical protein